MGDLTVTQAAESLGFQIRWVRELLATGKLQGHRNGRRWLISEEEVERYRSGKNVGQKKVLNEGEGVDNPASRGSLLTDLMLGQVNESMSRHCIELRSEAGRWRDIIREFHSDGMRVCYCQVDLESMISESSGSLINVLFCTHLGKELPPFYEQCCQWHKQALNLKGRVLSLQQEWTVDVMGSLEDGGRPRKKTDGLVDWKWHWHHFRFPIKLWNAIFEASGLNFAKEASEPQNQGRLYKLKFGETTIASGTEQATKRAKALFESLYEEQKILLPEKIERLGLFAEFESLKENTDVLSHKLDIISNGGVFKPGTCEVCALLIQFSTDTSHQE